MFGDCGKSGSEVDVCGSVGVINGSNYGISRSDVVKSGSKVDAFGNKVVKRRSNYRISRSKLDKSGSGCCITGSDVGWFLVGVGCFVFTTLET
ncbi:hypothetical protein GM921_12955 [Pedobacter sp. LMG 31464]|uniref:Uncharacterized protein n=1 Tax=Pedobacter planticolens TaxID=2679964 RepID=A0A923E1L4_9SPHI|nr:hypothetical protein [Pedobacter planticolens]MBB2146403.1 hypothetical protein [Pedobacter planticolens]